MERLYGPSSDGRTADVTVLCYAGWITCTKHNDQMWRETAC